LLGCARRGLDCTFVVIDNDGGGIFNFLPQASELEPTTFEHLFGTPHGVDITALAAVHGIPTTVAGSAAEVAPAVSDAISRGGVRLVLVRTDRRANVAMHDELAAAVELALG